jgi:uncharacterized protein
MPDELHQPLGQRPSTAQEPTHAPRRWSGWTIAYGLLGSAAVAAGVYVARYGDPNGGFPRVVATIETVKPSTPAPQAARDVEPTGSIENRKSERQSGQEVERQSGVKVTRAGGGEAPGALIIQLDEPSGVRLAPAPDKRLVERDRFGPLPRIGADGAKPWQVYARPVVLSQKLKPNAPRIALIVGGLGISPATTQSAMEKLPAEVSFAFAPYGDNLSSEAAGARDAGHEVFLQAPMEPFDYPQNDPGPHTLTIKATPDEASVDLRWLMTRFTGYVGIVNFLGARFTASETALTPFMRDLASRGVAYVDDGSSPQSLAPDVARNMGAISARADIVLDADGKPEAMEAALTKLEAIARQQGFALGVASAIPQSIERVARFARGLESRGVALVPASAVFSRPNTPQADSRRP